MSTVAITHTQVRSVIAGPTPFQVVDTVTAVTAIPLELFTYLVASSAFDHVATVQDLELYPNTRAAAVTANVAYYRQAAVTQAWDTVDKGTEFSQNVLAQLRVLANDYAKYTASFAGTTTETIHDVP